MTHFNNSDRHTQHTFIKNLKPNSMKTNLFLAIVMLVSMQLQAQKTISGTVSDASGPLPGVSVLIQGTTTGSETDFDGKYEILAEEGDVLQFSYIGMHTVLKTLGSKTVINVLMKGDSNTLDEVVVTAYGVKRERKSLTYQTQKVSFGDQKVRRNNRLAGIVAGIVAGLQIKVKNKGVNPTTHVVLRGMRSDYKQKENNEVYDGITENTFKTPKTNPLSTFSIDVDKASYSNIRRMINSGQKVTKDAVKIEEMINYFNYEYDQPTDEHPFAIHTELGACPWNEKHQLVKIGLQGKKIITENLPPSNLVFLIDVSGSMSSSNKLPLLITAFKLLVNQLREQDRVSIVVYAGAAGVVLKPTSGENKQKIMEALNNLNAGGSTAGGAGIELAYSLARKNFKKEGNNRVILATDGDFNVGASSDKDMEQLITEKRKSGVFLTVLGFGMGNYKDSKLETLADKGNGNHAYIDTMQEAQKVLGEEFGGTLFTIAKDVKIQVEFNPNKVQAYRLIGYENRLLNDEDFVDDTIDAGEIGSGHSVTALYEVIPIGVDTKFTPKLPKLKYSNLKSKSENNDELLTVKFRYKKPEENISIELIEVVSYHVKELQNTTDDFKFASSVAMFGMQLRNSKFKGNSNYDAIIAFAKESKGNDIDGYRSEFIRLVKSVK